MRATPRQEFVPPDQRQNAFFDMALPIGHGQTISPPFVVAFMTEQLDPQPGDKVLEVGTGSGYQAAVLSPLVRDVYTVEINETLGQSAAAALARGGLKNVHTRVGDGYAGWPEASPFDKIIVTCSPEKVPQPLIDQLREGGRMIVPVGERFQQTLYLFTKVNGKLDRHALQPTMFVPMIGTAEQRRLVMPDGRHPKLLGGSMEKLSPETNSPDGWYYLRHAKVETDSTAPDGERIITFTNDVPGRSARALQALAVDGRSRRPPRRVVVGASAKCASRRNAGPDRPARDRILRREPSRRPAFRPRRLDGLIRLATGKPKSFRAVRSPHGDRLDRALGGDRRGLVRLRFAGSRDAKSLAASSTAQTRFRRASIALRREEAWPAAPRLDRRRRSQRSRRVKPRSGGTRHTPQDAARGRRLIEHIEVDAGHTMVQ